MRKTVLTILLMLSALALQARNYGCDRYSISVYGNYGYNMTWKDYGGIDVRGFLPLGRHFEMAAGAELLSAGVFAATVNATPKFPLPVGEIFIDGTVCCRSLFKYSTAELVAALSAGYRMDYVSAQIGAFYRGIFSTGGNADGSYVGEIPVNVLYRLAFNVRPVKSRWNAGGGITNFSVYEYERMWQPMLFIDGRFDINEHFGMQACVFFRQAGFFHQIASIYGIDAKVGVSYRF